MKSFKICFLLIPLLITPFFLLGAEHRLICPQGVRPFVSSYIKSKPVSNNKSFTDGLQKHLINNGFTFAKVNASESSGVVTIIVQPGFYGKSTISGNTDLSNSTIINNLDWETGKLFNYKKFYTETSRLNRNRFIQVDAKLKPVRSSDGEIQVNADFNVEDSFPISPYVKISNDGTEQSSGWRATAGFEVWEAIIPNDRFNLSYTLDPKDASQLSSYFVSYQLGGDRFKQTIFAGYSDSEYENVASSSLNMDIAGDGFFTGYSGVLAMGLEDADSFAFNFGFTYLDLSSQIYLGSSRLLASSEDLSLFLPRIGFQGKNSNPGGLSGSNFWSIGVVSDLSSSDDSELAIQNPELKKGFWVPKASFAFLEPLNLLGTGGGVTIRLDGQVSNESLPTSLKKSIGGMSSVRGYQEREAYGDSGVSMNFEYSLPSESSSVFGLEGSFQKLFFYDAGHVSNEGLMASAHKSIGMQSFGAGVIGNFEDTTDISLQVGVPLTDTLNTRTHDARTHFTINFRF
jgi:hemolysin activation/secretion protein